MAAVVGKLSALIAHVRNHPTIAAPARAKTDGPLDAVNDGFHASYDRARNEAKHDGPVFIVLADTLVVFQRGERAVFSFAPRAFHIIKSVAHAPVMLYALFARAEAPTAKELSYARSMIASARKRATTAELDAELTESTRRDLTLALEACAQTLDEVGVTGSARRPLDTLAQQTGPLLLRLAAEATKIQLQALHEHTERAVGLLSAHERAELQVVVTGDHQARVRSLAMQYFRKRLPEPAGAETRVTYAEGVSDEHAALALIGTQRLDRTLARAFFGEEKRLQRDILGDAAEEQLRALELSEIV